MMTAPRHPAPTGDDGPAPDPRAEREAVLGAVRRALAPLPASERTPLPDWDADLPVCRAHPEGMAGWDLFVHRFKGVNGTPLVGLPALGAFLKAQGLRVGYCEPALLPAVSALPEFAGLELHATFDRARVDDYAFGITRAAGAIAETGTVILSDRGAPRLAALAPWVHAAVLAPGDVVATVQEALARLGDDPYVVWATGPSKTADVEGILIEGVHGPGIQVCCLA